MLRSVAGMSDKSFSFDNRKQTTITAIADVKRNLLRADNSSPCLQSMCLFRMLFECSPAMRGDLAENVEFSRRMAVCEYFLCFSRHQNDRIIKLEFPAEELNKGDDLYTMQDFCQFHHNSGGSPG